MFNYLQTQIAHTSIVVPGTDLEAIAVLPFVINEFTVDEAVLIGNPLVPNAVDAPDSTQLFVVNGMPCR